MSRRRPLVVLARVSVLVLAVAAAWTTAAWVRFRAEPLLVVGNVPEVYPRRTSTLSANVSGTLHRRVSEALYRLNGGAWTPVPHGGPRADPPLFSLELSRDALRTGENELEFAARAAFHPDEHAAVTFRYDPSPVVLPVERDWQDASLEVQDGLWESALVDGEWRVRPVPGLEGYDRILLVTGAFPGGRRIETDVIYRYPEKWSRPEYIFGVLTLWSGHGTDWTHLPRAGYRFALACYWTKPGGAGSEVSVYRPGEDAVFVNTYRSLPLEPGRKHHVVAEVVPERDADGTLLRWTQRVKWWLDGEPEPEAWQMLSDDEGCPLTDDEYAVALLVYRCQVDFGPVRVTALPDG
ncbi:MAG: hypothetical protein H6825_07440 [Planctomycetes bacterium]|nr:hypothetical protein [Planctomycetota bacterium]